MSHGFTRELHGFHPSALSGDLNPRFLCVGKDLHSHSAHRLRFTMHHTTNPLRRFAAKSRLSAACAEASRDALDQHIFHVDHKYFVDQRLMSLRRTTYVTEKQVSFYLSILCAIPKPLEIDLG